MAGPIKRLPMLPAERALKVISGRWKAVILYHLFDGPRRLSSLKALVPSITQKVLIQQLREMEEHGLVRRKVFAEIPSRVEYSATPLASASNPSFWRCANGGSTMPTSSTSTTGWRTASSGRGNPRRRQIEKGGASAAPYPLGG